MASKKGFQTNPPWQCDERENTYSTNHQIQHHGTLLHDGEIRWNNKDEKHDLSVHPEEREYCSALTLQHGRHQDPTSRKELYKRCHWFDDFDEPVGTNAAMSPPKRNHPKLSPKQVYGRMKSQPKVSPTDVCNLTAEECEFELSAQKSQTASCKSSQFQVGVCLPPGCIPSNMIVQVTREESHSGKETKAIMEIDGERDLWLEDICHQALTIKHAGEPRIMTAPFEAGVTIVHDLQEEICPEIGNVANTMFNGFLQRRKAAYRRNAMCEELEMMTGFVKINGAKFSLWHLRKDLLQTKKRKRFGEGTGTLTADFSQSSSPSSSDNPPPS